MTCCLYIWYSCFIFIFWCLMNDFICLKFLQFITASVRSILLGLSFTWFPFFIWCAPSHSVSIDGHFMVTFLTSCAIFSCVDVGELVPMWPEISLWIKFEKYLFLLISDFSSNFWGVCSLFPFQCWIRLAMADVRVLLDSVSFLFEEISRAMTSLT